MIAGKDVVEILNAIVPMYFPLTIAYITVRWFDLFTAEQSAGISRFLRMLAIPFLAFKVISSKNLLATNLKLFAADSLQKLISLAALFLWNLLCKKNASLDWMITLFSFSSLPNTLIIGLPMATAMYGQESASFMIQTLVFQNAIWINVLIILFEYRAARIVIAAERLELAAAEERREAGECGLVDLSGLTVVLPEKTVVSVDRDGGEHRGFPAKEIRPADGGGCGSGHLGIILEGGKEDDLRSEDSASPKDTGQALSMFSLGIFMAAQPNFIACSMSEAASAMVVRFLISPMLIAAVSQLVGLHGIALNTAIIQAAFPQGVVSFVLAKEYNVYPNVLSTSVVVGMLIAFPIILTYYVLLGAIFN